MSDCIEVPFIGVQGAAGAPGGGGGGGSTTFIELTDTPESYTASRLIAVNGAADSVIFPTAEDARTLLELGTAALSDDGDFAAASHTHAASEISDSTATGRSVLTAADAAAIRTLLSAYSSTETDTAISDAIASLIGAAPSALDTLAEIADAINDDETFAATMNAALANRLRLDAAGGYTSPQQAQGRSNLGLGTAATSNTGDFAAAIHALQIHSDVANPLNPSNGHAFMFVTDEWVARDLVAGDIKTGQFSMTRMPTSVQALPDLGGEFLSASTLTTGETPIVRRVHQASTIQTVEIALPGGAEDIEITLSYFVGAAAAVTRTLTVETGDFTTIGTGGIPVAVVDITDLAVAAGGWLKYAITAAPSSAVQAIVTPVGVRS